MNKKSRGILLNREFFERDAKVVARELLGKFLVRRIGGKEIAAMITETEAYDGPHDKASHAYRGKTKRNGPMFGEAGVWYVYLCYGVHEMLNIVTGPKEYPAAVLIRGIRYVPTNGMKTLKAGACYIFPRSRKCVTIYNPHFTDREARGPGRVTKGMKIGRVFNNKKSEGKTGLWIEDRGVKIAPRGIRRAARIGVSYAGPVWSAKKYRFSTNPPRTVLCANPQGPSFVSAKEKRGRMAAAHQSSGGSRWESSN